MEKSLSFLVFSPSVPGGGKNNLKTCTGIFVLVKEGQVKKSSGRELVKERSDLILPKSIPNTTRDS